MEFTADKNMVGKYLLNGIKSVVNGVENVT